MGGFFRQHIEGIVKLAFTTMGLLVASATAWALLTSDVRAVRSDVESHEKRLGALEARLNRYELRMRDLEWNGYLSCLNSSEAAGKQPVGCRRPDGD